MASITKRSDSWQVKWRDPDGRQRGRKAPNRRAAEALARDVEACIAEGRRWTPRDSCPVPRLGDLLGAYIRERGLSSRPKTIEKLGTYLQQFLDFADPRQQQRADVLSKQLLVDYYRHITTRPREVYRWTVNEGEPTERQRARVRNALAPTSALKYLRAVEQFWRWAYDNDEENVIPRPRRLDVLREEDAADVVAPSWAEMDACIAACRGWYRKLAILMRFTGLRVTQAMHLEWGDVDFGRRTLTVRANLRGSKRAPERKGRVIPISRHLLTELAGWGAREGYLIDTDRLHRDDSSIARGMARAWARSGVRREVWDAVGGRKKRRVDHCFRDGLQSNLKEMGADTEAVKRLVGHKLEGSREHYIDPNSLPMRAAVDMIPPLGPGTNVRQMPVGSER